MIPGVPYDAEVEYLESTGTQWIDTGVALSSSYRVVCDILLTGVSANTSAYAFGVFDGVRNFGVNVAIRADDMYLVWASTSILVRSGLNVNRRLLIALSSNGLFVDGVKVYTPSGTFTGSATAYLLWANGTGQGKAIGSIYAARFYDDNGTLVRDFIPVRVGQTGYMYDRVTKRLFGNKGNGSFVLGPDVATPVMGLRMYPNLSKPYDAELEWISSESYGHIMTGLKIEDIKRITCVFGIKSSNTSWYSDGYITGQHNNWHDVSQYYRLTMTSNGGRGNFSFVYSPDRTGSSSVSKSITRGVLYNIDFNPEVGTLTFDGTVLTSWEPFVISKTLRQLPFMAAWNDANSNFGSYINNSGFMFGPCRFYTADGLARDYVPVRIGQTGYIYDRANPFGGPYKNGLIPSAGNAFTLGPDKGVNK